MLYFCLLCCVHLDLVGDFCNLERAAALHGLGVAQLALGWPPWNKLQELVWEQLLKGLVCGGEGASQKYLGAFAEVKRCEVFLKVEDCL